MNDRIAAAKKLAAHIHNIAVCGDPRFCEIPREADAAAALEATDARA